MTRKAVVTQAQIEAAMRKATTAQALALCGRKRTPEERLEAFTLLDQEDLERGSVVYIADNGRGCVKIGRTIDLYGRIAILRTADPCIEVALSMPGGRALESELHARFSRWNVGKEWFELSGEIKDFIASGGKW